jgi:hypothetical protein
MKKAVKILFASMILFSSCQDVAENTPSAIRKIIRDKDKMANICQVDEFDYDGQKVYAMTCCTPTPDFAENVFDEKGNCICRLSSFAGMTCINWENARFIRTIYKINQ